jgi:hypothetical protein
MSLKQTNFEKAFNLALIALSFVFINPSPKIAFEQNKINVNNFSAVSTERRRSYQEIC